MIDLAAVCRDVGRDPEVFERGSLNAFLAQGPGGVGRDAAAAPVQPHRPVWPGPSRAPPEPDQRRPAAPAHRGRRLRRLLRLRAPCCQCGPDVPPGRGTADPQLEAHADRLSRPRPARSWCPVRTSSDRAARSSRRPITDRRSGPAASSTSKPSWDGWWASALRRAFRSKSRSSGSTSSGSSILNDWSARDLQAWEYVPLGPFLGKSFATSISAWVLPLEALDDAQVELPDQEPELLPYLRARSSGYDIDVEVLINGQLVSTCPYARMYYSPGADGGPSDDQRGAAAHGGSLRFGHDLGTGRSTNGGACSSSRGTAPSRSIWGRARRGPSSRTAMKL